MEQGGYIGLSALFCLKTDAASRADAGADGFFDAVESSAADEQNVGRVHLEEFLMRMLASTLRRYVSQCPFNDLQERLLHAFAGDIAGDRGIVMGFAGDLVNLINVDDTFFRAGNIAIRCL